MASRIEQGWVENQRMAKTKSLHSADHKEVLILSTAEWPLSETTSFHELKELLSTMIPKLFNRKGQPGMCNIDTILTVRACMAVTGQYRRRRRRANKAVTIGNGPTVRWMHLARAIL